MIEKKDCASANDWTKEGIKRFRMYKEFYQNKKLDNAAERENNKCSTECNMGEVTVRDILKQIEKYDNPFEEIPESVGGVNELLNLLRQMPDKAFRMKGSYTLSNYNTEESELFYIKDMVTFQQLLEKGQYTAFLHEVCDFLNFKILHDDRENGPRYLPLNIKNALIYVIETATEERQGTQ